MNLSPSQDAVPASELFARGIRLAAVSKSFGLLAKVSPTKTSSVNPDQQSSLLYCLESVSISSIQTYIIQLLFKLKSKFL